MTDKPQHLHHGPSSGQIEEARLELHKDLHDQIDELDFLERDEKRAAHDLVDAGKLDLAKTFVATKAKQSPDGVPGIMPKIDWAAFFLGAAVAAVVGVASDAALGNPFIGITVALLAAVILEEVFDSDR